MLVLCEPVSRIRSLVRRIRQRLLVSGEVIEQAVRDDGDVVG